MNFLEYSCRHDSYNITEPFATWPLKDTINLLQLLERNGYNEIYFDGNNAVIYVMKK